MGIFYISGLGFAKRIFISIIIIIEIAILLFSVNYIYSAMEGRKMLFTPYENFLTFNSMLVMNTKVHEDRANDIDPNESKSILLSGLSGSYREIELLNLPIETGNGDSVILFVCDDDIFSEMNLPLSNGKWVKKNEVKDHAIGSYSIPDGPINIDLYEEDSILINIKGRLTINSYMPNMSNYKSHNMSCIDFYSNVNSLENRYIIMGKGALKNTDYFFRSYTSLLVFDNLSVQDKQFNEAYLRGKNAYFTYGDELHANSIYLIYQDLKKFYPLIACVALVVLIGILSFACIVFKHSQRDNGIYFMCGNTRFGSMKILAGELLIILLLGGLLTVSAFWGADYVGLFNDVQLTFNSGNIAVSLVTVTTLMFAMLVIPYIFYVRNLPIETIRSSL